MRVRIPIEYDEIRFDAGSKYAFVETTIDLLDASIDSMEDIETHRMGSDQLRAMLIERQLSDASVSMCLDVMRMAARRNDAPEWEAGLVDVFLELAKTLLDAAAQNPEVAHLAEMAHKLLDALESYAELDRLSAQGVEVPDEIPPDALREALKCGISRGWEGVAESAWVSARQRTRPAPPHPDTVEVSREEISARLSPSPQPAPGGEGAGTVDMEFLRIGYAWLDHRAGRELCSDRSCIRCRLADILFHVEREINALRAQAQPATERSI